MNKHSEASAPGWKTDQTFLEQLRAGDTAAYEQLYRQYYPSIAYYVKNNQGNEGDAEDIFQESVIILHRKISSPGFQLSSTLKTYLYAIAKNRWLKRLRDEKLVPTGNEEQLLALPDTADDLAEEAASVEIREAKVHEWLSRITSHCQHVLKSIFFQEEPIEQVMSKMGWKNRHTAINQKYKCIQQIKKVSDTNEGA